MKEKVNFKEHIGYNLTKMGITWWKLRMRRGTDLGVRFIWTEVDILRREEGPRIMGAEC